MQKIALYLALFALSASRLTAAVTLNAGQSYDFEFSTLAGYSSSEPFGWNVSISYTTFAVGDAFHFELLENLATDAPFATNGPPPIISGGFLPGPSGWGFGSLDTSPDWNDLQGIVRFTVDSGSVFFDTIEVSKYLGGDSYSQVFSIPEPHSWALLVFGTAACLFRRNKTRRAEQDETQQPPLAALSKRSCVISPFTSRFNVRSR